MFYAYDTLFSPELPNPLAGQQRLFDNAHIGNPDLTNLDVAGVLSSEDTVILRRLEVIAWFDTEDSWEAERLFALLQTGVRFTIWIGDRPYPSGTNAPAGGAFVTPAIALPPSDDEDDALEEEKPGWAIRHFYLTINPRLTAPARQNFGVTTSATKTAVDAINEFSGQRLMRVIVRGIRRRELRYY